MFYFTIGYYMFVFIRVYRQNKHAKIAMGYIKRTKSIFVYTVILIVIYWYCHLLWR